MNNFNFFKSPTSFTGKLTKDKPDNHGNCPAKFKSLLWFERGKLIREWGGIYD